jgi:PleD family two-component response regulator
MSQSVWVSLVFFLAHAASPATLIAAADAALYQAKSLGRDRVILHPLLNQLQFQR